MSIATADVETVLPHGEREMSEPPEDRVLLLHASDGLEWAHFIATKLAAPVYNITCKICKWDCYDDSSATTNDETDEGDAIYSNCYDGPVSHNSLTVTGTSNDGTFKSESASGEKPMLPEKRASKIDEKDSDKNQFTEEINTSRACVILVSPSIVESSQPLALDIHSLKTGSTVFIFLGVELEDARGFFGTHMDAVMKCKCGFVHSTEQQTISDALIQIIEAYEDDGESEQNEDSEGFYNYLPSSRQLNQIEKIFPKQLSETERDVYIMLSWPPEDSVQLVFEDEDLTERKIDLSSLSERLYTFTLPDDIVGDVLFYLECQGQKFGLTKLKVPNKLEQLRVILEGELNPLALLASAVNLSKDDLGDIDVTLAHKLQQLSPPTRLHYLFPFEDEVRHSQSDRPSSTKWPTLLHFAAEWNFRTLCSELLRYPRMVLSACTENSDGEFPSHIASRKGFKDLEADLVQFIEKERELKYTIPGPPLPPPRTLSNPVTGSASPKIAHMPSRKPRVRTNSMQNNGDGQLYIDMASTGKPSFLNRERSSSDVHSASRANTSVTRHSQTSRSFGQGDTNYKPILTDPRLSNSHVDILYATMEENSAVYDDEQEHFENPNGTLTPDDQSPQRTSSATVSPTSLKALKRLGVDEADIRASMIERSDSPEPRNFLSASCPPGKSNVRASSKFYVDGPDDLRASFSSNWEEDITPYEDLASDGKQNSKKEKKSFFSKIKSSTKWGHDFNIGKKLSVSKGRRGSGSSEKSVGKSHLILDLERDSGSYSDEDNETVRQRINRSKGFKESNKPMRRRFSRRVENAKKEHISAYPDLPSSGDKSRVHLKF